MALFPRISARNNVTTLRYDITRTEGGYYVSGIELKDFSFTFIENSGWFIPEDRFEFFKRYATSMKLRSLRNVDLKRLAVDSFGYDRIKIRRFNNTEMMNLIMFGATPSDPTYTLAKYGMLFDSSCGYPKGVDIESYAQYRKFINENPYLDIAKRVKVPLYYTDILQDGAIVVGLNLAGEFNSIWRDDYVFSYPCHAKGGWFIPMDRYDYFVSYMHDINHDGEIPVVQNQQVSDEVFHKVRVA